MISNLKEADIEIWSMVGEVRSVCRRRTSYGVITRSWETAAWHLPRRTAYTITPSCYRDRQNLTNT